MSDQRRLRGMCGLASCPQARRPVRLSGCLQGSEVVCAGIGRPRQPRRFGRGGGAWPEDDPRGATLSRALPRCRDLVPARARSCGRGLGCALLRTEAVQQEVAEFGEGVAGGQAGPFQEDSRLDRVDGDRDDLGGEMAVERAEDAGLHALLDQFVDPARRGGGVRAVDLCGRFVTDTPPCGRRWRQSLLRTRPPRLTLRDPGGVSNPNGSMSCFLLLCCRPPQQN